MALLVVFGTCAAGVAANTDPERVVELVVRTDRQIYARGQPLTVELRAVNRGSSAVRLDYPTAQRYDLIVRDAHGQDVWRWSADRMFAQARESAVLAPAGQLSYRVVIRERLPGGRYTLIGLIPTDKPVSASIGVTIE